MKQRMRNREQYQDFLKCLNMFTEEIISKEELRVLVSDSLNRHPDLQVAHEHSQLGVCMSITACLLVVPLAVECILCAQQ